MSVSKLLQTPDLISFWDFQEKEGSPRKAQGPCSYELKEMDGGVGRVEGGIFGAHAALLRHRQWFSIPRKECPMLDIHGASAQVSVVAWLKRHRKPEIECEFVAGIWNETRAKRQYGLFLDLRIHHSADQVCGHVSAFGGPSTGARWCMDAAIGGHYVGYFNQWYCAGFTYDGNLAKAYYNGMLDLRDQRNPYAYPHGIFDAGESSADFTVGAVDRSGTMGNWFTGVLGGLAVFNRALTDVEMDFLAAFLPDKKATGGTQPGK